MQPRAEHDRHGDESALAEANVRFNFAHEVRGLERARGDAEGVSEILPVEVAAELSGLDAVVDDAGDIAEFLGFHAVFRADVVDFVAGGEEVRQEGEVGGDVTHRAPAGKDDFSLHG